jgi:hypothetical protein
LAWLWQGRGSAWACVDPDDFEIPQDGVDQDCDGADGIHQKFWAGFSWFSGVPSGWSTTGTVGPDKLTLAPGESVTWTGSLLVGFGGQVMMIDADQTPTEGGCLVAWKWRPPGGGPWSGTVQVLNLGTTWYAPTAGTSVTPLVVEEIVIDCSAAVAGDTQLDWLVLQNSKVPFPPFEDLELSWSDTDMPWGGFNTSMTLRGGDRVQSSKGLYQGMVATLDVPAHGAAHRARR